MYFFFIIKEYEHLRLEKASASTNGVYLHTSGQPCLLAIADGQGDMTAGCVIGVYPLREGRTIIMCRRRRVSSGCDDDENDNDEAATEEDDDFDDARGFVDTIRIGGGHISSCFGAVETRGDGKCLLSVRRHRHVQLNDDVLAHDATAGVALRHGDVLVLDRSYLLAFHHHSQSSEARNSGQLLRMIVEPVASNETKLQQQQQQEQQRSVAEVEATMAKLVADYESRMDKQRKQLQLVSEQLERNNNEMRLKLASDYTASKSGAAMMMMRSATATAVAVAAESVDSVSNAGTVVCGEQVVEELQVETGVEEELNGYANEMESTQLLLQNKRVAESQKRAIEQELIEKDAYQQLVEKFEVSLVENKNKKHQHRYSFEKIYNF